MGTRNFHWDPIDDCVVQETDQTGSTLVTYTREPRQAGPLMSEERGGTEYYHHYDALGSTTIMTDDTGAVTDSFSYDPWGTVIARAGSTATPYQWAGQLGYQRDSSTGSYYIRARAFMPAIARWTSVDPLGSQQLFRVHASDYIYVGNAPADHFDPSGLLGIQTFVRSSYLNCGFACNAIDWTLDADERNGFIIQKVSVEMIAAHCPTPGAPQIWTHFQDCETWSGLVTDSNLGGAAALVYYEMWLVRDGGYWVNFVLVMGSASKPAASRAAAMRRATSAG